MRLPVLLIAVLALVVLAAGCGGGGGGGTSTSEATTGAHEATTGSGEAGGTTAESGEGGGKPKAAGEREGEGGEEEPTGAPPSALFVKQINAMCGQVQEGLSEAVEEYEQEHETGSEKVEGEVGAQATAASIDTRFESMIDEVRELGEQNGEGEAVEPYLEALEGGISNSQEPTALAQVGRAFVSADKVARAYGLKSCIVN